MQIKVRVAWHLIGATKEAEEAAEQAAGVVLHDRVHCSDGGGGGTFGVVALTCDKSFCQHKFR